MTTIELPLSITLSDEIINKIQDIVKNHGYDSDIVKPENTNPNFVNIGRNMIIYIYYTKDKDKNNIFKLGLKIGEAIEKYYNTKFDLQNNIQDDTLKH